MCFVVLLLLLYQLPDDPSDDSRAQLWGDENERHPEKPPVSSESEPMEEDVPETPAPTPAPESAPTVSVRSVRSEQELTTCCRYFQDCDSRAADRSL